MIEVFKTNVNDEVIAQRLIKQLHDTFIGCSANFDLTDCDLILRLCHEGVEPMLVDSVIDLFKQHGYCAEELTEGEQPLTITYAIQENNSLSSTIGVIFCLL
ncbi:hypothetical protein [Pedobacter sp. ASV28]|uniref:hypothetical protein n=1 Tax=Pedobacter sp. ASV28 TaxID=2795123 RepID=UPI0018EB539E|nr:hypothetical protein [Pedobacter sp. ASV28]